LAGANLPQATSDCRKSESTIRDGRGVNYAGGDGTVTGKEKPTKSCDTGKLYFLWRVVGLSIKTFAAELPKRLLNWVYTKNPQMNLKNTLLMAAFGLIMSAYSVQTTDAQVVTVQAAKASSTPISSLPSNIVAPGTYALTRNLNYPAGQTIPAIVIANNLTGAVVVDLKGFTIASSGDLSFGVNIGYYNVPASNAFPITIRNGTLTNFSKT
jgi:hypothetical protein